MTLFLRPKVLVPVASMLAGSLLVASQAPRSTAADEAAVVSSCTLNVPAKVVIKGHVMKQAMTLGPDCAAAGLIEAKWEAKNAAGGVTTKAFFNFNLPTEWYLFDAASLGKWTWYPTGARGTGDITLTKNRDASTTPAPNAAGDRNAQAAVTIPQNTPTTDIRLQSNGTFLSVDRTQLCVLPLRVYGERYNPASVPGSYGEIPYAGGVGSIQQLVSGTTTWTSVSGASLPSSGWVQANILQPKRRTHYRFVLYDAATIWGSTSALLTEDPIVSC